MHIGVIATVAMVASTCLSVDVATAATTSGELRIRQRVIDTGSVYIEGAHSYVEVRRARDNRLLFRKRSASRLLSAKLPLRPGYYRVTSWTQSCVGTCDALDPPSERCEADFRVLGGSYLTATIHSGVGTPCRITNP